MRFLTFLMILISCAVFSIGHAIAAGPKYTIKFATVAPEGSTWIIQLKALDKALREQSHNRVGFRIYAGGIAGDELDTLKKIRIGQVHCTGFSGVGFGQILPMVRVLDLPFLFNSYEEADLVHKEMRTTFADQFRKKGVELLAWSEIGNVYLFSKKEIKKTGDLSGLKVWIWSGDPIAKATFAALGVNPIPLAITDVTTALNTGMIDTIYAPPIGALALQWYTSINYMLDLPIVHSTGAVLISGKYFNGMPKDLAALLVRETETSMEELTQKLRDQNKEAVQIIQNHGVTITPTPKGKDLAEFRSIHKKVAQILVDDLYPAEILDRINALLKQKR